MEPQTEINPADGIANLMPDDIPDEFYKTGNPYVKCAQAWLSRGISRFGLKAKPNVQKVHALRHMSVIMRSWEPKHEDKIAGVAYLMSQWFDLVNNQTSKRRNYV